MNDNLIFIQRPAQFPGDKIHFFCIFKAHSLDSVNEREKTKPSGKIVWASKNVWVFEIKLASDVNHCDVNMRKAARLMIYCAISKCDEKFSEACDTYFVIMDRDPIENCD